MCDASNSGMSGSDSVEVVVGGLVVASVTAGVATVDDLDPGTAVVVGGADSVGSVARVDWLGAHPASIARMSALTALRTIPTS